MLYAGQASDRLIMPGKVEVTMMIITIDVNPANPQDKQLIDQLAAHAKPVRRRTNNPVEALVNFGLDELQRASQRLVDSVANASQRWWSQRKRRDNVTTPKLLS